jgi:putative methyltransferase (TIGR04325 family)
MLAAMVYAEQKKLKVLDFGGGIGFTYYQTMGALPQVKNAEYHIVERDAVCKAGREFFEKDGESNIYFHEDIPQEDGAFDIVHLSSAIQYIEEWKKVLTNLCALSPKYLLLVDIYAGDIPTYVSAQNYYGSRIPMWFFNLPEFVQVVKDLEYELIFKSVYPAVIRKVEQDLPMQNLDEKYRLKHACNLLFVSRKAGTVFSSKDNQ